MDITQTRKQARAMDLPGYSHPPFVRDIPNHAGTWGWVYPRSVAQDDNGLLWADGAATLKHELRAETNAGSRALLAWTDHGIAAWIDPRGYDDLVRLHVVDDKRWEPIAAVMTELPGYAEESPR